MTGFGYMVFVSGLEIEDAACFCDAMTNLQYPLEGPPRVGPSGVWENHWFTGDFNRKYHFVLISFFI